MALEFKLADFAYPISIFKLRASFEKSQWFTREEQILYQERRLRLIVEHAYRHVPYYRELFDRLRLRPGDIRNLSDLEKIPVLNKDTLSSEFKLLRADNSYRFRPQLVRTSGTTGRRIEFFVDKYSNVLEFAYYWRHWGWAGYHLRDKFAEFSSSFFLGKEKRDQQSAHFQRATGRLLLNSIAMSDQAVDDYVAAIKKHRPLFLKGLASVLYYFSLFLRKKSVKDISFKAVFSTGELLLPHHRKVIEETLGCKVYNSYGHMERTVAISECPAGSLHINSDYGILELSRQDNLRTASTGQGGAPDTSFTAKVIGTSLYNFSMPLIRYDVGDYVEVDADNRDCACGRKFPVVSGIQGRQSDVIVTPEGQVVTAMFLVFEDVPGIITGQISQESPAELLIRVVPAPGFSRNNEKELASRVQRLVGPTMKIAISRCVASDLFRQGQGKFKVVESKLEPSQMLCY